MPDDYLMTEKAKFKNTSMYSRFLDIHEFSVCDGRKNFFDNSKSSASTSFVHRANFCK